MAQGTPQEIGALPVSGYRICTRQIHGIRLQAENPEFPDLNFDHDAASSSGLVVSMFGGGVLFAVGIGYIHETLGASDAAFGWLSALWGLGMGFGLLTVRRLACALNAEDKRHQVPPADVFGRARRSRRTCHIFSQDEIDRLLRAASHLTPTGSIRPVTYTALLSLIVCTGLRVSEALKLELSDLTEDGLLIRATKFQKSGSPAALKDLKVGDKVVIHATGPEEKLAATEVRFGSTTKGNMSGMKGMDHNHPSDPMPENH